MSTEIHAKLTEFLASEFKRTGGHQCVQLDLVFSMGDGWKDELIQDWRREEQPEIFDTLALIEKLVSTIIERAQSHADSFGRPGNYRFMLRTKQHLGGGTTRSFGIKPNNTAIAIGEDSSGAGAMVGGGPRAPVDAVVASLNILARNNGQMHQSTIGAMVSMNKELLEENRELKSRTRELERELDAAKSDRMEREWAIQQQVRKADRTDAGFQRLLQMGSLVAARLASGSDPAGPGASTALATMMAEFGQNLRADQIQQMIAILDMSQRQQFQEIMMMAAQQAEAAEKAQHPPPPRAGQPNGAAKPA